MYPDTASSQEPVLGRWGSRIHAVLFYVKNWNATQNVVKTFSSSDFSAIFISENILSDNNDKKYYL